MGLSDWEIRKLDERYEEPANTPRCPNCGCLFILGNQDGIFPQPKCPNCGRGEPDKVEETLKFIRQVVSGRCDKLDLSVIRQAINECIGAGEDGNLRLNELYRETQALKDLLHEIDKWCSGENQVGDGEDAEDALKYIQAAVRGYFKEVITKAREVVG